MIKIFNDSALTHKYRPQELGVDKFDCVLTDPPWNSGILRTFNKWIEVERHNKILDIYVFLRESVKNLMPYISPTTKILIEMGKTNTPVLVDILKDFQFNVHEIIGTRYGQNGKANLIAASITGKFSIKKAENLHGAAVIGRVLELVQPKNVVDPFMGKGLNMRECSMRGIPYYGVELSKQKYLKVKKYAT